MDNLDHWMTKSEAARELGVTEKTVQRLSNGTGTKAPEIEQRKRQEAGGGQKLAVYNPDDIARVKAKREGAAFVMTTPSTLPAPVHAGSGLSSWSPSMPVPAPMPVLQVRVDQPGSGRFLRMKEAVAHSGLPQTLLLRLIACGALAAVNVPGAGWRIRQADLDSLDMARVSALCPAGSNERPRGDRGRFQKAVSNG